MSLYSYQTSKDTGQSGHNTGQSGHSAGQLGRKGHDTGQTGLKSQTETLVILVRCCYLLHINTMLPLPFLIV